MQELVLNAPQLPMVEFMLSHDRGAVWAGMGIGKTSAGLHVADALPLIRGDAWPVLALGPPRVARNTWPDEQQKWSNFRDMKLQKITGDPEQRAKALKSGADVFTANYEQIPWLVEHFDNRWPFKTVIADEAEVLKGFRLNQGGQRAGQLGRVAHSLCRYFYEMTGTPSPNGLKDLWGQMWFLDRGQRLGRTHGAFMDRWFRTNQYTRRVEPMPFAEKQIHEAIADLCISIDPKDYYDLEEPIVNNIKVPLETQAMAQYREFEKELFLKLENGVEITAVNAGVLTQKLMQLANGSIYTDAKAGEYAVMHNAKLDALQSVLNEAGGMPLLVQTAFRPDVARILKAFPSAVDLATERGMSKFCNGEAAIGAGHPQSVGRGLNDMAQVTNQFVRFGWDWNNTNWKQMLERIGPMRQLQAKLDRNVFVHNIFVSDTIDEECLPCHVGKATVQDCLLNYMKRRA